MTDDTKLIFFGKHTSDWTTALTSSQLLERLSKYVNSTQIIDDPKRIPESKYLFPLMENHAITLHKNNIKAIMPKLSTILAFKNKYLFHIYACENKLDNYIPHLYSSSESIDKPVIIKPVDGYASSGMTIVENEFSKIPSEMFNTNKYIIEEYFYDKHEYVTHIVALDGKIIKCITYQYTYKDVKNIKFKNSSVRKTIILDSKYIEILEKFLKGCSYSGVCNFNFRIINDVIKVFEINARLGGSLMKKDCFEDLAEILSTVLESFAS